MIKWIFLLAAMVAPAPGWAQTPAVLKDSGLKKLAVFGGTWKAENDPDSAGRVSVSAISTCQWSPNGRYLVCDQEVTNQGTTTNNLSIYTRNADNDGYTLTVVGVPGMQPFTIPITYKGDELYYLGSYTDNGGKKIYTRTVNTFLSSMDHEYAGEIDKNSLI